MTNKILILINEETTREAVKTALRDEFRMVLTEDPDLGLSCIKQDQTITLAICDVSPEMSKTIEWLKAVKISHPEFPVIIIASALGRQTITEILEEGVAAFLHRPFKTAELLAIVKANVHR